MNGQPANALFRAARVVVVLAIYCAGFVVFDYLSTSYAGTPQSSPWYLSAALTFYLVYTFGEWYAPAPILAEIIRYYAIGHAEALGFGPLVEMGIEMMVVYGTSAAFLRRVVQMRLPFADLRDVLWYVAVGAFVAPAAAGFIGVAIFMQVGMVAPIEYLSQVFTFATGDTMGFLTLVPALALFVTPHVAPELARESDPNETRIGPFETSVLVVILFAASAVGYRWLSVGAGTAVFYFMFLPLVWTATRGGLRFATIGIMCTDLSVVALDWIFRSPVTQSLAYQSYIAASSLTALMLGAVVTQRWRAQRSELERARLDRVTGLPNPQAFDEWMESRFRHMPTTLLLVAIDNMRWVHEGLNRKGVDAFLYGVGERLSSLALGETYLAHVSEAEFAIVLNNDDRAVAAVTAEKIRRAFEQPVNVDEEQIYASVSVGIANNADGGDLEQLVPYAEHALDEAHSRGVESVVFYQRGDEEEPLISLAAQLHRAVQNDEFELLYQPIFALPPYPEEGYMFFGARAVGAEALLRWNHPTRGLLAPDQFIDLLESLALSERVGNLVVRKACAQLAMWRGMGIDVDIWINGFVRQVLNPEFPGILRATLMQHNIEPRHIMVELLERVIAREEGELLEAVNRIRQSGVRVAIDDFGTGNSSLARLNEVPFDMLKVDRSFIAGIDTDRRSEDVVMTLSTLARDFDVPALAEGVESESQLHFLIKHRYQFAQGYYLGLPMPATEMEAVLQRTNFAL